jgi:hypothetical protein
MVFLVMFWPSLRDHPMVVGWLLDDGCWTMVVGRWLLDDGWRAEDVVLARTAASWRHCHCPQTGDTQHRSVAMPPTRGLMVIVKIFVRHARYFKADWRAWIGTFLAHYGL